MCLSCHTAFSDSDTEEQLRNALSDPKYELWNSTSFNHIIIAALGYNGSASRELAITLLNNFNEYLKAQRYAIFRWLPTMVSLYLRRISNINNRNLTQDQIKADIHNLLVEVY